jgi:hypothetical protein
MEEVRSVATFPAQALPCSGSTGIISAFPPSADQHPEESEKIAGEEYPQPDNAAKIGVLIVVELEKRNDL